MAQEDVRELFAKYGELAGVRLVTYRCSSPQPSRRSPPTSTLTPTLTLPTSHPHTRNGHSKGIAFVEYSKEGEAAAALVKTDGTNLKGGQLQVCSL